MVLHRIIIEVNDDPSEEDYIVEVDGESINDYETAYPKNWFPLCFDELKNGYCFGELICDVNGEPTDRFEPECVLCPFKYRVKFLNEKEQDQ